MKGYLTVNKMSKLTGIAPSALRYYAKIGLFTPDHVDPETRVQILCFKPGFLCADDTLSALFEYAY